MRQSMHREHGMCRTNVWVDDQQGLEVAKNIAGIYISSLEMVLKWYLSSMVAFRW